MSTGISPDPSRLLADLRRLWSYLTRRRHIQFGLLLALMLVAAMAELLTLGAVLPFLTLMADPDQVERFALLVKVADALDWQGEDLRLPAAMLFATLALLSAAVRILITWAIFRYVYGVGHDIGVEVYTRTLHQPYAWHVTRNSSESIATISRVQTLAVNLLLPLMQALVAMVLTSFILAVLLWVDALTALIAFGGFAGAYALISRLVRRRLHHSGVVVSRALGARVKVVQEGLGRIRDVILDGAQSFFARQYGREEVTLQRALATNQVLYLTPRYALEGLAIVLFVLLALHLVQLDGGLTSALPVLGALALGGQKLLPLMQAIYQGWSHMASGHAVLADVLGYLATPRANEPAPVPIAFDDAIELHNVGFRYSADTPLVLQNVSLRIPRGARVGFVGPSGSGKSTLLDLIMGLLEPSEGQICIDGVPLTARNRHAWRMHIAHVPQAIYLSDTSIAENIAFGVSPEHIDWPRVRRAAEQAQIADFIETLPHGYETLVGERGVRLSGGQRQRLAIARALYRKADVLVLDEATNALDEATERSVIAALDALGRKLTTLIVAHYGCALESCDFIVRFQQAEAGFVLEVNNQGNNRNAGSRRA